MTKQEFEALVARGPVLLDGAMGSNLLERGMPKGALSELWADRHPETVLELQAAYAAAGSRILYAPTFQAQPEALAQAGWTGDVGALNARLVALTRRAAGADTLVAGDLATMAGCLESWNPENFHRMTDRYRRQIGGLLEGGADLLVAETLLYPQEAEAVLLAAELEGGDLPVLYSFTMQPDGALFSGQEAGPVLRELEEAGAAAVGFNCVAAGPALPALVSKLRRYVRGPLVSKPNAGNPTVSPEGRGSLPGSRRRPAAWARAFWEAAAAPPPPTCPPSGTAWRRRASRRPTGRKVPRLTSIGRRGNLKILCFLLNSHRGIGIMAPWTNESDSTSAGKTR